MTEVVLLGDLAVRANMLSLWDRPNTRVTNNEFPTNLFEEHIARGGPGKNGRDHGSFLDR